MPPTRPTPSRPEAAGAPPPPVLPLFPLTGSLLLPGNWMPLNVFEPRYVHMVEDCLAGDRHLGMIQPVVPRQDNRLPADHVDDETPALYTVGCSGRIARYEPQSDGRYLILLQGVCRFRVREELAPRRGYRRVRVDYAGFAADLDEAHYPLDPDPILAALADFARTRELEFDLERLETLPGVTLLNGLAVALPFTPGEKQALLEADDPEGRRDLLLSLMGMGFAADAGGSAPPVVH